MKSTSRKILLMMILVIFICSCGGYHKKIYEGPELDKSQVSIITTDDQFLGIGGLDGERTIKKTNVSDLYNIGMWGRYPRTITVLPGEHKILPCFGFTCLENWLCITAEPGQSYLIKHKCEKGNDRCEIWIDKQEDSERTAHQKMLGY